jgi:hypothetical protein
MTNNDHPSSQAERRAMIRQDREASTYHAQAKLSEQLDAGRYKSTIIGSEESVRYPAASGHWSGPQPGPEPELGIDVNYVEAVGPPAAPPRPTLRMRRMK